MKTRALIVEDEPVAAASLQRLVSATPWLECVGCAGDGETAVRLGRQCLPEIVFLDVEIPNGSGLEIIEKIPNRPMVVLTTCHDRYALPAFDVGAIDFLLKPFGRARFEQTVERIRDRLTKYATTEPALTRVFVRHGDCIVPIRTADVTRIEACDDYTILYTPEGQYTAAISMAELEAQLDPDRFLRIHRSHIVNVDCIQVVRQFDGRRLRVILVDGTAILTSRTGAHELRRRSV